MGSGIVGCDYLRVGGNNGDTFSSCALRRDKPKHRRYGADSHLRRERSPRRRRSRCSGSVHHGKAAAVLGALFHVDGGVRADAGTASTAHALFRQDEGDEAGIADFLAIRKSLGYAVPEGQPPYNMRSFAGYTMGTAGKKS